MKKFLIALSASCAFFATHAVAQDNGPMLDSSKWFVHLGGTIVSFDSALTSSSTPFINGASVTNNITGNVEVGYYLTNNISASLSAGFPPTNELDISTLKGPFKVGNATYGSFILDAQYHFGDFGGMRPYVGGGLAYNVTFSTTPNAPLFNALTIDNGVGAVLQAGVDVPVSEHFGLFIDAKKMIYTAHATATGVIGTASVDARLNPWILSTGVSFNF